MLRPLFFTILICSSTTILAQAHSQGAYQGLRWYDAHKHLELQLRAFFQGDAQSFINDSDDSGSNGLLVRRARIQVQLRASEWLELTLQPSWDLYEPELLDAFVMLHIAPQLKIVAGKFRAPFGLERLQTAPLLMFMERSLASRLTPNREVGMMVTGQSQNAVLEYQLGVFNGTPDGTSGTFPNRDGATMIARVFGHPLRPLRQPWLDRFGLGAALTWGTQKGDVSESRLPTYSSPGRLDIVVYGQQNLTPFADGKALRMSLQGYYYWQRFGLLWEYVNSRQRVSAPNIAPTTLSHHAWQISTTWLLTNDQAMFDGVNPRKPLNLSKSQWGAWELGLRFAQLHMDAANDLFVDPRRSIDQANNLTWGINWYLSEFVKLQINYAYTWFLAGEPNDNRPDEHILATRLQYRL